MTQIPYPKFKGISYPTISLFFTTAVIHALSIDYFAGSSLTTICLLILHTLCSYIMFTVMHDAGHKSIATNHPYINDLFGWLSQFWMGPTANFYAFRYIHNQHHKHVNDPKLDPDYWVSHDYGNWKFLCWFFVDITYWKYYIPKVIPWRSQRPIKETIIVWTYHAMMFIALFIIYRHGLLPLLYINWILPARLSKFILAFAFDYLPHCDIQITRQQCKYLTAYYLDFTPILRPILALIMCYHNYHIAHHLNSCDPWWRYAKYYYFNQRKLESMGTITKKLL